VDICVKATRVWVQRVGVVVLEIISGGEHHVACLCGKLGLRSNREGAWRRVPCLWCATEVSFFFSLSLYPIPSMVDLLAAELFTSWVFFLIVDSETPFSPFPFRLTTLTSLALDSRRTHLSQNH
jgi:hypothetical protein